MVRLNFEFLRLLGLFLTRASTQVIDLRTRQPVQGTWFEAGSSTVSANWITVKSEFVNYSQPAVFFSIPLTPTEEEFRHPLQIRASSVATDSAGSVSFTLKLLSTNDSSCSKQWWIPSVYSDTLDVSWFIVEEGGYLINGSQVVVGTAEISGYVTKVDWEFSFGSSCNYPSHEEDDDYAPGGIFSLQTTNNDGIYLTARTTEWWHKGDTNKCSYAWYTGRFFLEPHDGYPPDDRFLLHTETLAYFLFDRNPMVVDCLSGYLLEIGTINGLTDQPTFFPLKHSVDVQTNNVGVFGSVIGYRGGDSFVMKSFYEGTGSSLSPYIYLQEDQCSDEETTHLPEIATIIILSTASETCSDDPSITLYSNPPTLSPTLITNSPTSLPTKPTKTHSNDKGDSELLLAILLPVVIVSVIAIVGLMARAYFAAGKGDLIPLSDESGNNLVFDT